MGRCLFSPVFLAFFSELSPGNVIQSKVLSWDHSLNSHKSGRIFCDF